jgi:hypothetical protein
MLRSEPSKLVNDCIDAFAEKHESEQYVLYREEVNYSILIENIFAADRVISWW